MPEHEFKITEVVAKTGQHVGQSKYSVVLVIPPYVFKRRSTGKVGCITSFTCNGCAKLSYGATAKAVREMDDLGTGRPHYVLKKWPKYHVCLPSAIDHKLMEFRHGLYEKVRRNPTGAIPRIYSTFVEEFASQFDEDEKALFMKQKPAYQQMSANMYRTRREPFLASQPYPDDPPQMEIQAKTE